MSKSNIVIIAASVLILICMVILIIKNQSTETYISMDEYETRY